MSWIWSDETEPRDERIRGVGDFVKSVLNPAREQYEKKTLAHVKGLKLETLIERVTEQLGLVPADDGCCELPGPVMGRFVPSPRAAR